MADPTGYSISYSFTGFQNNAPTTPLPAPALDNELLNIATSIASIVSAVQDVRRDDGALPNGIVTFDSLALAVQLMLDPTNADLVAGAVAAAQAAAVSAGNSSTSAAASAAAALVNAVNAAASAATVNLNLYLAKANNLAGLGSNATARQNLGLGSVATFDVGAAANNIVQLDASAKIPAYDGSQLTNIDVVPVGTTLWINATTPPASFVKENGALLSRASYPRLYAFAAASGNIVAEASWAANTGAFSTGDLSTTFRVPDLRGEFIRGFDDSRGVDSGRVLGAHQADMLKNHTHDYNGLIVGAQKPSGAGSQTYDTVNGFTTTGASIGGAENRPRNHAKLACIKY